MPPASARKISPARRIGAVYLRMAISALLVDHENFSPLMGLTRMTCADVAALAEHRHIDHQHVLVDAAVRDMAIEAVRCHRRVHPEERPALFGVTAVADLIDHRRPQLLPIRTAVRIVAVGAGHRALAQRHVRRQIDFHLFVEMAAQANLRFGARDHERIDEFGAER